MTTEQNTLPKATLVFTIANPSDFKPIMETPAGQQPAYTTASLALESQTPGVRYDPATDTVYVTQKAWLEFSVAPDTSGPVPVLYHVVGLAYQGSGGDVVGAQAFPKETINSVPVIVAGQSTLLRIIATKDADPNNDNFDFDLVIQRSTDGAMGVIDPKITNET